jgi:DHA1 family multidrug resistance protein-like MFS transporter
MESWKKTFYAAWIGQVLSITAFAFVMPFLPLYIRQLGVQDEAEVIWWAGWVNAATPLTMALTAPIWGVLADRYGRKVMVLRSMLGGAVVLGLMGFCQTVQQLFVCRLLQGVLTGTVTAYIALVASETPRARSGYTLGMMQAAVFVGASVGPSIGGYLADAVGYRWSFVASGGTLLVGGLLVKYLVTEHFAPAEPAIKGKSGTIAEVLAGAGFLTAVFTLFTVRVATSAPAPVFPLFVERIRGSSVDINTVTGLIVSASGVSAAVSAGLFGRLSDAWGHKRLLIGFSVFSALVSTLTALAQNMKQLFLLRILFGLGAAGMMPAANSIIRQVTADRNLGKAYGLQSSLGSVGMALGPLAGGYLGASMGLRAPFVLTGIILAVAAALVVWRIRTDAEYAKQPL